MSTLTKMTNKWGEELTVRPCRHCGQPITWQTVSTGPYLGMTGKQWTHVLDRDCGFRYEQECFHPTMAEPER